jgi:hypothetical protein
MKTITVIAYILLSLALYGHEPWLDQEIKRVNLRGRVTDLYGNVIPEAAIDLIVENDKDKATFSTKANSEGRYEFKDLPRGMMIVTVKMRGFEEERVSIAPTREALIVDIGLVVGTLFSERPSEVSGTVKQDDGVAMSEATVTIVNAFNYRITQKVRTDGSGKYTLAIAYPGQYTIYASKDGFANDTRGIAVPPGKRGIDFLLTRLPF